MSTGAMLLIGISIVAFTAMLMATYFRNLAERAESGEPLSNKIDPDGARRMSTILFFIAPVMWLIVALICLGVIPSGIDPIKF